MKICENITQRKNMRNSINENIKSVYKTLNACDFSKIREKFINTIINIILENNWEIGMFRLLPSFVFFFAKYP